MHPIGLLEMRRRLAVAPQGSRPVVFLNLLFLLTIIVLPVTNGLYGSFRLDSVVAVIYGAHLIAIAALNALLWALALRGRSNPEMLARAIFPVFVFTLGTATAFVALRVAQFIWCLAFGSQAAGGFAGFGQRREKTSGRI